MIGFLLLAMTLYNMGCLLGHQTGANSQNRANSKIRPGALHPCPKTHPAPCFGPQHAPPEAIVFSQLTDSHFAKNTPSWPFQIGLEWFLEWFFGALCR